MSEEDKQKLKKYQNKYRQAKKNIVIKKSFLYTIKDD